MSIFFERNLSIRATLRDIIESEDRNKPFSDSDLVKKLKQKGYKVARRTVAKYRNMEGILPGHLRKKENKKQ